MLDIPMIVTIITAALLLAPVIVVISLSQLPIFIRSKSPTKENFRI